MLGKQTYEQWPGEFDPSSSVEGDWAQGSKINFVGTDENGKRMGMFSEIVENIPNELVSIKHLGVLDGDKEIFEGPEVEKWVGLREIYRFEENEGSTTLSVEQDLDEAYKEFFDAAWQRALEKLQQLCES